MGFMLDRKKDGELVKTVLFAVAFAMVFRSFAFEPFHIPSGSMKGTLEIGDYLFVSKYTYGYSRYSFPFAAVPIDGRTGENRPKRGDIVVFRNPTQRGVDFIKRVIGLPGDRIQMKDGTLYLNEQRIPKRRVDDYIETLPGDRTVHVARYEETLPNGKKYLVLDEDPTGDVDNTDVYTVPAGHYFMMGDNRDNSTDSRFLDKVGYVPEELLIGPARIILFSTDGSSSLLKPWTWPGAFRTDRFLRYP